jgi:hypothetical protein
VKAVAPKVPEKFPGAAEARDKIGAFAGRVARARGRAHWRTPIFQCAGPVNRNRALFSRRQFPLPTKEFPARAKEIPVPMRREFGCKPLKLPFESTPKSQNWARIREIPC